MPAAEARETSELESSVERLVRLLGGRRLAVLTGAGISTESGIPDYRGPGTLARAKNPVQYRAFLSDEVARRRYWARSVVGYRRFFGARPNPAHRALAQFEASPVMAGLITQNVDGLHTAADSQRLIELHGRLSDVRCLACGSVESRASLQQSLLERNPGFDRHAALMVADGDAELPDELCRGFQVPECRECGGVLKPDVVFFGEAVPRDRVERAYSVVEAAQALLVLGSSLTVFSGFRFVRRARERGLAIAIVNLTPTRGDPLADLAVAGRLGALVPPLLRRLG